MARKKKRKIAVSKKSAITITLIVVILGLILLISNRTIVKEPKYEIKFHNELVEIFVGDEIYLNYSIINSKGDDKLIWTTSNGKIATIDANGKIKGISFGDVKIIVELVNGNTDYLTLRVKSYPVYLKLKTDIQPSRGWYNKPVNVTFEIFNISDFKYCVSKETECTPINKYKNKITLKNGTWHLQVSGIDKNGKTVTHREVFNIDTVSPKCSIMRLGKLSDINATIDVNCEKDSSGIDTYEWYRDNQRIYITDKSQIDVKKIYSSGNHKYSVKVFDTAGNSTTYSIDN